MSSANSPEPDNNSVSSESPAVVETGITSATPESIAGPGLSSIVRKALNKPEGKPGEQRERRPGKGRRSKPPGGDAPGDDGETDGFESRDRFERKHIPVPSKRAPLSSDLEAEMAAALGDLSLDDVLKEGGIAKSAERLQTGAEHRAQVMKIHGDNVFFSLGGRHEGVCSLRTFTEPPAEGDMCDVVVTGRSREDGLYDLSIPGGKVVASDWVEMREGAVVNAKVTGSNTGGLEAQVGNLRAFIPAQHVGLYRIENLAEMVGQTFTCIVTEANERRGNLVLSRRAVLEREREAAKAKILSELEPGQTREGIVRKIMDFGAFVDLGGVDGLIHISQLSWERIKHPSEVLTEGQKLNVRVNGYDPETQKISLSYRSEADHPWKDIDTKFPVGTLAKGTVSRIAEFGAFVKLAAGVEGLIHISELAHHKVFAVKNVVKEGDEIEVKILSMDAENQRMSLSLRAAQQPPAKEEKEKPEEPADEAPRSAVVPKRSGPLKGGTKRSSGGEQFGLNW